MVACAAVLNWSRSIVKQMQARKRSEVPDQMCGGVGGQEYGQERDNRCDICCRSNYSVCILQTRNKRNTRSKVGAIEGKMKSLEEPGLEEELLLSVFIGDALVKGRNAASFRCSSDQIPITKLSQSQADNNGDCFCSSLLVD